MDRRTIPSLAIGALAVACAVGAFERPSQAPAPLPQTEALPEGADYAVIQGVVLDRESGEVYPDAIVILSCHCLEEAREAMTDGNGVYRFGDLPEGQYTVNALYGKADVSQIIHLKKGLRTRIDFRIEPKNEFVRT